MTTAVFLLSTNYAGSTLTGSLLCEIGGWANLGEPALIVRRDEHGEYRHRVLCGACRDRDGCDCPVWDADLIGAIREADSPGSAIASRFETAGVVLDNSKSESWYRSCRPAFDRAFVVHLHRRVEGFASSVRRHGRSRIRHLPSPVSALHASLGWARTNQRYAHLTSLAGADAATIRYEDVVDDPIGTLEPIVDRIGRAHNPPMLRGHPVKGNPAVMDVVRRDGWDALALSGDDRWRRELTPVAQRMLPALPWVRRTEALLRADTE